MTKKKQEMPEILPKDNKTKLRALNAPNNEELRRRKRNACGKYYKGTCQTIGNINVDCSSEDLIEQLLQPTRRRKTANRVRQEKELIRTGKPIETAYSGLINPLKLNISSETLNAIKKGGN